MLGYDTIHFFLDGYQIPTEEIDRLCSMLSQDGVNKTTGERWSTGNISNLKVTVSELGVSVKGSLAAFLYPTNTLTVSRQEARHALEKLSDTLRHMVMRTSSTWTTASISAAAQVCISVS